MPLSANNENCTELSDENNAQSLKIYNESRFSTMSQDVVLHTLLTLMEEINDRCPCCFLRMTNTELAKKSKYEQRKKSN